jgi:hypothetical protein
VASPGVLLDDIEVLTDRDLGAHQVELAARGGTRLGAHQRADGTVEDLVAPAEEEVAQEQARRLPEGAGSSEPVLLPVHRLESLVRGGATTTGVRVVHDVVVHQSGRVEHLEGGRGAHDRREVRAGGLVGEVEANSRATHRLPTPVAEQGPEPLAPGQQIPREVKEVVEFLSDRTQLRGPLLQKFVYAFLNKVN